MRPELLVAAALVMTAAALLIAFVRVVRGPSLLDRVVAVDLISVSSAGLMVLGAVFSEERAFLDAAVIIALLGFLGTVAYARYAEREKRER
jgi:multicomponent Na+:H+ antiporter subunit F